MQEFELSKVVDEVTNLFEDPDLTVSEARCEPAVPSILIKSHSTSPGWETDKSMIIQFTDEMIKDIQSGRKTVRDVARAIINIYDAFYPLMDTCKAIYSFQGIKDVEVQIM